MVTKYRISKDKNSRTWQLRIEIQNGEFTATLTRNRSWKEMNSPQWRPGIKFEKKTRIYVYGNQEDNSERCEFLSAVAKSRIQTDVLSRQWRPRIQIQKMKIHIYGNQV